MPCGAMWRSTSVGQEAERSDRKAQATDFIVFSMLKTRQGRRNSLGLATLNNSSRLWGIRAVLSSLEPGPGLVQGRGNTGLVCESQIKVVVGCMNFGSVGLYWKSCSQVSFFIILEISQPWEEQSIPSQAAHTPTPICQNVIKYRK